MEDVQRRGDHCSQLRAVRDEANRPRWRRCSCTRLGRHAMAIALVLFPVAAGVAVLALLRRSVPVLGLALLIGGVGLGVVFRSELAEVSAAAPDEQRGEVVSAFFIATYADLIVPVILAGLLLRRRPPRRMLR